jgi:hypothetical protein
MVEALAPPSLMEGGANKSRPYFREEPVIRVQPKKKKRCISAIQTRRFFLSPGGGGIG